MAKLVIIVDVPDVDPTKVDPHEQAAEILYHYEEHNQANGNEEPEVRFVQASWQGPIDDVLRFFEAQD
jgi:hypothetical protein